MMPTTIYNSQSNHYHEIPCHNYKRCKIFSLSFVLLVILISIWWESPSWSFSIFSHGPKNASPATTFQIRYERLYRYLSIQVHTPVVVAHQEFVWFRVEGNKWRKMNMFPFFQCDSLLSGNGRTSWRGLRVVAILIKFMKELANIFIIYRAK